MWRVACALFKFPHWFDFTANYEDEDDPPPKGVSAMAGGGAACMTCGKTFKSLGSAHRHYRESHLASGKTYQCHICGKVYKLQRKRKEHLSRDHGFKRLMGQVHVPSMMNYEDEEFL